MLEPAQFLDVAEETGLIVPIGAWVIAEAHRQATLWAEEMGASPTMWVNLSARQLMADPLLVPTMARTLGEGDPRITFGIEITEDTLISDPATATTIGLRDLGVQVSIDDFGTGYSSLSYLKQFPAQALKVDSSFVAGLGADPKDTAILTAVLGLARALALDVVAEGVETPEQVAVLRRLGCGVAQGYHFSRPLPGAEPRPVPGGAARERPGPIVTILPDRRFDDDDWVERALAKLRWLAVVDSHCACFGTARASVPTRHPDR